MATELIPGQRTWSMTRDEEGHREYKIKHLVRADYTDGPANVLQTPGLPIPGAPWIVDNDIDLWAWCRANAEVTIHEEEEGDKATIYAVVQTFATKPPDKARCQDTPIEDPLLEPPRVSGSFVIYSEEATEALRVTVGDRVGTRILNSAWEQMRGPQCEFDAHRQTVQIEQNVPSLQADLLGEMCNTVNDATLWSFPARCIKFTPGPWSEKYHGQCYKYYTRQLLFDIFVIKDPVTGVKRSGHDRIIHDEGSKALHGINKNGEWVVKPLSSSGAMPNRFNPQHFVRYKDAHGENTTVILDGFGQPVDPSPGSGSGAGGYEPGEIFVEKYYESNFLLLGVPLTLG